MMTPEAMQIVRGAIDNTSTMAFDQLVAEHNDLRTRDTSRAGWLDRMVNVTPSILAPWRSVSTDIMAGMLDSGTSLGISVAGMNTSILLPRPRVVGLVKWTMENTKTPTEAISKLAGIGQKLVQEGPRQYSSILSTENDTTARRFAQPGACEWCRYLSVQEHRYEHYGSEWAPTNDNDRFHEHCRCVLIPASEFITPDYIEDWDDQFSVVEEKMTDKYGRRTRTGRIIGGGYGPSTWREYMSELRKYN